MTETVKPLTNDERLKIAFMTAMPTNPPLAPEYRDLFDRFEVTVRELEAKLASPVSAEANVPTPTGCQSHSCEVAAPQGMGTNGPCSCSPFKLRSALQYYRRLSQSPANVPTLALEADLRHAANYYESIGRDARADRIREHLRRLSQSPSATRDGGWWPAFDAAQRVPVAASAGSAPETEAVLRDADAFLSNFGVHDAEWTANEGGRLVTELVAALRRRLALSGSEATELYEAAHNFVRCSQSSNLSPYISENGRNGGSPWAELVAAVEAARAATQGGRAPQDAARSSDATADTGETR